MKNYWVYDMETYPNCITLVAKKLNEDITEKFVISDLRNDYDD